VISDTVSINISTSDVTKYMLTFTSDIEGQPPPSAPVVDPKHRNELVEDGTAQDVSKIFVQLQDPMPILDISPALTIMIQSDAHVPEPSSGALLYMGLATVLGYHACRRKCGGRKRRRFRSEQESAHAEARDQVQGSS
jgi:hypothetical protein